MKSNKSKSNQNEISSSNSSKNLSKNNKYLFYNPRNDYIFKYLFSGKDFKLVERLSYLITDEVFNIKNFLPNEAALLPDLKKSVYDFICEDVNGNSIIIEMANCFSPCYFHKVSNYAYLQQVLSTKIGYKPQDFTRVIVISILNFKLTTNDDYVYKCLNECHPSVDLYFLQLDLLDNNIISNRKKTNKMNNKQQLENWMYFFKYAEFLTEMPKNLNDDDLTRAYGSISILNQEINRENFNIFSKYTEENENCQQLLSKYAEENKIYAEDNEIFQQLLSDEVDENLEFKKTTVNKFKTYKALVEFYGEKFMTRELFKSLKK